MSAQDLAAELARTKTALRALYFFQANRSNEALAELGIGRAAATLGDDRVYEIVMTEVKRVAGPTHRQGAYDQIDGWLLHPRGVWVDCPGCSRSWVRWRGEKPSPCPACDHELQVPPALAPAPSS